MDDEESPEASTSTSENIPALAGWSKAEKFELLQGIKAQGSHKIRAIQRYIPGKTLKQIEAALNHYKKIALDKKKLVRRKGGRPRADMNLKPSMPLSQWAKFLTDNVKYEDLQTEVATALRLIAEFEAIPETLCTDMVDFRKAYHMLANAVEGKSLQDDQFLTMLLSKSVVETALTSKVFLQSTTVRQIVENIRIKTEQDVKSLPRPASNKELLLVQHFADQSNYNPLNLTVESLKSQE
ncbi:hypothetical protein O0L34_g16266 [Tuta absoluta]|nr:hypothetical protein O0L34_g16266 [Tuta absoluta]